MRAGDAVLKWGTVRCQPHYIPHHALDTRTAPHRKPLLPRSCGGGDFVGRGGARAVSLTTAASSQRVPFRDTCRLPNRSARPGRVRAAWPRGLRAREDQDVGFLGVELVVLCTTTGFRLLTDPPTPPHPSVTGVLQHVPPIQPAYHRSKVVATSVKPKIPKGCGPLNLDESSRLQSRVGLREGESPRTAADCKL